MPKTRFRRGIGIALYEYRGAYLPEVREFETELLMIDGYIGFIDVFDETLRVFAFDSQAAAESALKSAHQIGFNTAGMIEEPLYVKNSDLNRPHIKRKRGSDYYKELYK